MEITDTIYAGLRSTADENVTFSSPLPLTFIAALLTGKVGVCYFAVRTRANFDRDVTQPFTFTQSGARGSECVRANGTLNFGLVPVPFRFVSFRFVSFHRFRSGFYSLPC